ncbi:hypothetical protein CEUSTIGMA_g3233.t1 [Chlamydomonas eustigma]|uniref:Uncharacterized protein n=1 Tax=Chlamydomonas eustigma TaxID=1157962 RepID=A0A250WZ58_9CHLO|nr:hypothetical protein CEUSTIGMA_g3233.t1 [Chlamydomonas eustigma]|eukprot:GAX75790.1 hypothetical protein CEUSTIGMA_g3233.t1 [Chlamydomonas eustigma]
MLKLHVFSLANFITNASASKDPAVVRYLQILIDSAAELAVCQPSIKYNACKPTLLQATSSAYFSTFIKKRTSAVATASEAGNAGMKGGNTPSRFLDADSHSTSVETRRQPVTDRTGRDELRFKGMMYQTQKAADVHKTADKRAAAVVAADTAEAVVHGRLLSLEFEDSPASAKRDTVNIMSRSKKHKSKEEDYSIPTSRPSSKSNLQPRKAAESVAPTHDERSNRMSRNLRSSEVQDTRQSFSRAPSRSKEEATQKASSAKHSHSMEEARLSTSSTRYAANGGWEDMEYQQWSKTTTSLSQDAYKATSIPQSFNKQGSRDRSGSSKSQSISRLRHLGYVDDEGSGGPAHQLGSNAIGYYPELHLDHTKDIDEKVDVPPKYAVDLNAAKKPLHQTEEISLSSVTAGRSATSAAAGQSATSGLNHGFHNNRSRELSGRSMKHHSVEHQLNKAGSGAPALINKVMKVEGNPSDLLLRDLRSASTLNDVREALASVHKQQVSGVGRGPSPKAAAEALSLLARLVGRARYNANSTLGAQAGQQAATSSYSYEEGTRTGALRAAQDMALPLLPLVQANLHVLPSKMFVPLFWAVTTLNLEMDTTFVTMLIRELLAEEMEAVKMRGDSGLLMCVQGIFKLKSQGLIFKSKTIARHKILDFQPPSKVLPASTDVDTAEGQCSQGSDVDTAEGQRSQGSDVDTAEGQRSQGSDVDTAEGQRSQGSDVDTAEGQRSQGSDVDTADGQCSQGSVIDTTDGQCSDYVEPVPQPSSSDEAELERLANLLIQHVAEAGVQYGVNRLRPQVLSGLSSNLAMLGYRDKEFFHHVANQTLVLLNELTPVSMGLILRSLVAANVYNPSLMTAAEPVLVEGLGSTNIKGLQELLMTYAMCNHPCPVLMPLAVEKILREGTALGHNKLLWVLGNVERIVKACYEQPEEYQALVQRLRQAAADAEVATAVGSG